MAMQQAAIFSSMPGVLRNWCVLRKRFCSSRLKDRSVSRPCKSSSCISKSSSDTRSKILDTAAGNSWPRLRNDANHSTGGYVFVHLL